MSVKTVGILGATGSVGQSAAAVIRAHPGRFAVRFVTAHSQAEDLARQAVALGAQTAVVADHRAYGALKDALAGTGIAAAAGRAALLDVAAVPCDVVLAAIVGFAGLEPILRAIAAGSAVAVANKEPLVAAGPLVMEAARRAGVPVLPVDSEHNAVFQVFDPARRAAVARLILTASGGPFRAWSAAQMETATPAQAVAHPNWSMGAKISVDSATMMNKALEVIEAHYLFDMPPESIDVLVHPQSAVHSMVEYADGSILAQMGAPDMKTPIAYCLGWPERLPAGGRRLDLSAALRLDFAPPDRARFPALDLAYAALRRGSSACAALNAANEVAVAAFLAGAISFPAIAETVRAALAAAEDKPLSCIEEVVSFDRTVRHWVERRLRGGGVAVEGCAA